MLAAAVAALAYVVVFRRTERARALRLLLAIGGMVALAVGTGWARSALGNDALFGSRYTSLAAPLWCAVYLAWEIFDGKQVRALAQMCLFFVVTALAVENHDIGKQVAEGHHAKMAALVGDINAGVPLAEIVRRHYGFLYYGGENVLKDRMRMLHARGIGIFRNLKE
jgi:hypothetical protein